MKDPVRFTIEILLTLVLGVVIAFVVTYGTALLVGTMIPVDPDDWQSFGGLISGAAFGLFVGYRFCIISLKSRKKS